MTVSTTRLAAGLLALAAGFALYAQAAPPKGGLTRAPFEARAFGLSISSSERGAYTRTNHADGRVVVKDRTQVRIAGKGSRTLSGTIDDQPIAKGGRQRATIVDQQAGQTLTFTYTPAGNAITIQNGAHSVTIAQNPDHSYSVAGQPAATGKAAVALLANQPAYRDASPHGLLLAYSYARSPNQAAKGLYDTGEGGPATPPAVCTLFSDFCACAACDKAGKGRACKGCK